VCGARLAPAPAGGTKTGDETVFTPPLRIRPAGLGAAQFGEAAEPASNPAGIIREFGNVQSIAPTMLGKLTSGVRTGKLTLYSDRIEFVPGALNVFGHGQAVIPISDVVSADFCDVMMMPLGAEVKTSGGDSHIYAFPVGRADEKKAFVEMIRKVIAAKGGS
jgi:hypothetical protein